MIPKLSSLASRNLRARKARSLLTGLGIILGVAVILAVAITNISSVAAFRQMVDSLSGKSDILLNSPTEKGVDASLLSKIRETAGVRLAAPGVMGNTVVLGEKHATPLRVAGIDPKIDRDVRAYKVSQGRFLRPEDRNALLAVDEWARSRKLEVGEYVKLAGGEGSARFRVVGIIETVGAGRFAGGDVAFTTLADAQKLFAKNGRLSFIDVRVAPGGSVDRTATRLRSVVGKSLIVERPEKRAEAVEQTLRSLRIGLSFFGAISLFVGAFLIFNTFSMVVVERTRELGMLRSIGADRRQIVFLILLEASIIGATGALLGLVLGAGLSRVLIYLVGRQLMTKIVVFRVPAYAALGGFLLGIAASLIGALQPALLAGRVHPLAAVRLRAAQQSPLATRVRRLAAILLLAAGLYLSLGQTAAESQGVILFQVGAFFIMLGGTFLLPDIVAPAAYLLGRPVTLLGKMEARLATDNLVKTRGRTAATAAAAMISLAMLVSIGGMTDSFKASVNDWVDKSIGADVFVSAEPVNISIRKSFADDLRSLPGVRIVSPVRFINTTSGSKPVTLRVIEPRTFRAMAEMQFTQGDPDEAWRGMSDEKVFVASGLARSAKLDVGDSIRLATPKGEKNFRVAGVILDFAGETGEVVVTNRQVMKKYFDLDDANLFRVKVKRGYRPADVADQIQRRWGKSMSLEIRDIQGFRDDINSQVNSSFASFNVIILLAVVVAGIGIINTLTMNILERLREIGILRAIGTSRGQIARMILAEAIITGGIGAAAGIGLGIYMAKVIVRAMQELTGFTVTFTFPWQSIWIALAIVFLFSTAAAAYPARRAAGVNIVEAIHYE